jgi:predicted regulator of Ras-like GTPase activity (Roadblock/LC7/MglB family)
MALEEIIKPLQEIDGYLAALVFDRNGAVLFQHNASKYQIELITDNLKLIMDATVKAVNKANLGNCQFVQINSDLGIIGAAWSAENTTVAGILLDSKSNTGLAKLALTKAAELAATAG